jgi:hypothetical protein
MKEPSIQELKQAIGSLLIVLGRHIPKSYAENLSKELNQMAGEMTRNGETNVGTLTKGFAVALLSDPAGALPKKH